MQLQAIFIHLYLTYRRILPIVPKFIGFVYFAILEKPIVVTAEEDKPDVAMVMLTTRKMVSSDVKLRHATAIVMMGVIGAEFQKEVDPLALPRDTRGQLCTAIYMFLRFAVPICFILYFGYCYLELCRRWRRFLYTFQLYL